jgi:hypothetical protein
MQIDPRLRVAAIPQIVLESNLDTNERMCIAVLVLHGEVCFPSRERIARLMGCSVATVKRTLGSLERKKWVRIEQRRGENGRQTSNLYQLGVPDGTLSTGTKAAAQVEPRSAAQSDSGPGSDCATKELPKNGNTEKEGLRSKPTAVPIAVIDSLLDLFAIEANKATGHTPAREWGRDRKMMRDVIRVCDGSVENAFATVSDWVAWRGREKKYVTVPALRSAIEAAYQKWLERQPKTGPGGASRVHPDVAKLETWKERVKAHRAKGGTGLPPRPA